VNIPSLRFRDEWNILSHDPLHITSINHYYQKTIDEADIKLINPLIQGSLNISIPTQKKRSDQSFDVSFIGTYILAVS